MKMILIAPRYTIAEVSFALLSSVRVLNLKGRNFL